MFGAIYAITDPIKNRVNEAIKIVLTLNLRVKNADNGIITPNTSRNEE